MPIHVKINKAPDRDTIYHSWLVYKRLCAIEGDVVFSNSGRISVVAPAIDGSECLEYIIENMAPTTFLRSLNFAIAMAACHRELHPIAKDAKYPAILYEEKTLNNEGLNIEQAA